MSWRQQRRAGGSGDGTQWPQQAPYAIGHTTVVIIDTARNPDGSTPVTSAGRPLYLHLWYPTALQGTQHVRYTWNNPIYNQNPGVLSTPACRIRPH